MDADALQEEGAKLFADRRFRECIEIWKSYLKLRPHDVDAINNLGAALATIGRESESVRYFDLAYSLDDSHLPSVVNYANVLKGRNRTEEALEILAKARIQAPALTGIRASYAAILFSFGDSRQAVDHTLHAWLGDFDSPRTVDQYLFTATYVQEDEAWLAAEHKFWAGTLRPRPHHIGPLQPHVRPPPLSRQGGKLRVGYWSPDMREHSVRYFFRPLLEGHDREKHEIFLYHDHPTADDQTEKIKIHADHFFEVAQLNDDQLAELLKDHDLDVLVELAGHTSANRLDMLRDRFATLQVTGLGYPPTTGLSGIDAKFLDRHLVDPDMGILYSETPAILAHSFWCFDPKEDIPLPPSPPCTMNGYITFGCFGNIGKITNETISCWGEVLARVADSRLVIRAVNFADPLRKSSFEKRLLEAGIPSGRVDLLPPTMPRELFSAYGEIDIILDTYPFNGGTTTCFATYSGVPVVSRKGRALASRMGESVLNNLGLNEWVVHSAEEYVEQAVRGAEDIDGLSRFRREARQRFQDSALGNGTIFARDVEVFYRNWLEMPPVKGEVLTSYALPASELVRRALITLRYGQFDVAQRIVDYCLNLHPDCGAAHILWTERLTRQGLFGVAAHYLEKHRPGFSDVVDRIKSLINETRFHFMEGSIEKANATLHELEGFSMLESSQSCQIDLLRCAAKVISSETASKMINAANSPTEPQSQWARNIHVCIVADDDGAFATIRQHVEELEMLPHTEIRISQCHSRDKSKIYREIVDAGQEDILVCLHANVNFWRNDFWRQLIIALEECDIVGCYGAKRWDRLEWRTYAQDVKAGAYLIPSGEKAGFWEVYALSRERGAAANKVQVIDGSFVAIRLSAIKGLDFEAELDEAGTMLEEYFSHCAARRGLRVGVSPQLGISLDWRVSLNERYLGPARLFIAKELKFDPWFFPEDDQTLWSVSLPSGELAAAALQKFIEENAGVMPHFSSFPINH
ncbi:hypothetical protein [Paracidovorax cattleyae]|uniref:O-linked N-acetylglucosamine transferase, SPINDLY family protein n=1 Tax=Paracidovorax cattleyae TaxID=80868 RepID=UPI001ABF5328|nr:hypothetical protein [Paracidovorax cattleyae]